MHGSVPTHRTRPIFNHESPPTWRPRAFVLPRRQLQRYIPIAALVTAVFFIFAVLRWHIFSHRDENPPPLTPPAPYDDGPRRPEFHPWDTSSLFHPVSMHAKGKDARHLCPSFPSHMLQSIQPVLKIGHADIHKAPLETQLASAASCLDNLLIFSDLDEDDLPGDRIAYDVLAGLPTSYRNNVDFGNYTLLRDLRRKGKLDVDATLTSSVEGWVIDKYKFLPMLERAWSMNPDRDWYVFFETDTYIFWDNMFRFLSNLDPDSSLYMGSPSPGRVVPDTDKLTWFANGGPGFVLSRGAMRKFMARKVGVDGDFLEAPQSHRWVDLLDIDCCGDSVLGWALYTAGVTLSGFWPLFNPHPLHGIPFSDEYWCQPVLTLHKTNPDEMMQLWRFEHITRQQNRPLLYRDLYQFHHPGLPKERQDWDVSEFENTYLDSPEEVTTLEDCGKACDEHPECFQYTLHGTECRLVKAFRYGAPRAKDEPNEEGIGGGSYTSGWALDKITAWRNERLCDRVEWVRPSISRIY